MSRLQSLYSQSPIAIQQLMVAVYGLGLLKSRYGGEYRRELALLKELDQAPAAVIRRIQETRLRELVTHALRHVPHYRDLARERQFTVDDVSLDTLAEIFPILDRREVRVNPERFVSERYRRGQHNTAHTSGTTGAPLKVIRSKRALQRNYAFFSRFLSWHGVSAFSRSATFAGRPLVPPTQTSPPYWRINPVFRNVQFSAYHISRSAAPHYLERLQKLGPEFIDTYPSAINALATHLSENLTQFSIHPKAIITSSETLLENQRTRIEKAFGCPVRDQYGSVEMSAFIGECEHGTYHAAPEYGLIEVVSDSSAGKTESGNLVTTGFINEAMPLIRYKAGDLAENRAIPACSCGRAGQTLQAIIGRTDDYIVTPDGRQIGRLGPVFKLADRVAECQIVQKSIDHLELLVVPVATSSDSEAVGRPILDGLEDRLPPSMSISMTLVDHIQRGANGKLRTVRREFETD